ncbi:MAG TPA: hypothetical protein VK870_12810 [Ignavibacteriaceae bacterium]|jgi:hypothetical protein|nr:hypothetical protein [Ignavibacteriaceae bacterium]
MPEKIEAALLKEAVASQFGNQVNLAKKMKISESQLSTALKVQSPVFMAKLKKAGLKLDDTYKAMEQSKLYLQAKIREIEGRLWELEKIIRDKDKVIEDQNKIIERYDKLLNRKK